MKLRPKSLTKKQAERAERIRRQYEADAHRRDEAPNQKKLDAALDAKGLIPWRRRCSILVPSPENLGQVRWEGTCRRCRKEKYLVIIERKKGKPDHYRKEGMFCGCSPVAGDNIQVESTNAAVNLLRDWDSVYRNTTVVSKSSMTLSRCITEKWIPARKTNPKVAGSTFRVDQQRAGYIIKDPIGAIRLQAITGTDAQAFLDRLIEEVGEESVKRIFGVL